MTYKRHCINRYPSNENKRYGLMAPFRKKGVTPLLCKKNNFGIRIPKYEKNLTKIGRV